MYGSNPEFAEAGAYPICTLSWVVAAADSGGVFGKKAGTTIRDYLQYAIDAEGGQAALHNNWYSPLPTEVANAAAVALAEIGGEGEEEEEGEEEVGNAVLCKVSPKAEAGVLRCPAKQGYAGKVNGSLLPEAEATFVSTLGPAGTVSCDEGFFSGQFAEDGTSAAETGVTTLSFHGSGGNCTSTLESFKGPVKEAEIFAAPFDASKFVYLAALAPQGAFVLAKGEGSPPRLALRGTEGKCYFVPTFLSGQVVNGTPTSLTFAASWKLSEGTVGCPETLQQTAAFGLVHMGEEEGPIYIAGE